MLRAFISFQTAADWLFKEFFLLLLFLNIRPPRCRDHFRSVMAGSSGVRQRLHRKEKKTLMREDKRLGPTLIPHHFDFDFFLLLPFLLSRIIDGRTPSITFLTLKITPPPSIPPSPACSGLSLFTHWFLISFFFFFFYILGGEHTKFCSFFFSLFFFNFHHQLVVMKSWTVVVLDEWCPSIRVRATER